MGNILDKQSGCMNVDTYSAIHTVKYKVLITQQAKTVLNPFLHSIEEINYTRQSFLTYVITCVMLVGAIKQDGKTLQKRIRKKILPWYHQTKLTHKERLEKKKECTPKQTHKI